MPLGSWREINNRFITTENVLPHFNLLFINTHQVFAEGTAYDKGCNSWVGVPLRSESRGNLQRKFTLENLKTEVF